MLDFRDEVRIWFSMGSYIGIRLSRLLRIKGS